MYFPNWKRKEFLDSIELNDDPIIQETRNSFSFNDKDDNSIVPLSFCHVDPFNISQCAQTVDNKSLIISALPHLLNCPILTLSSVTCFPIFRHKLSPHLIACLFANFLPGGTRVCRSRVQD